MSVKRDVPLLVGLVGGLIFVLARQLATGASPLVIIQWFLIGLALWGGAAAILTSGPWWESIGSAIRSGITAIVAAGATYFFVSDPPSFDRLASTVFVVVCAVSIIGGTWVVSNLLLNLAQKNWSLFTAIAAAVVAAAGFSIMRGNLVLRALVAAEDPALFGAGAGWAGRVEWPIFGALVWGLGTFAMRLFPQRSARIGVGVALAAPTGWTISSHLQLWQFPNINWISVVVCTAIGAALAGGIRYSRNHDTEEALPSTLVGAGIGFAVGAWIYSPFLGDLTQARIATIVPLVLIASWMAWNQNPTPRALSQFDAKARAVVFLGPAVLFLFSALVVPAIGTILLSFKDRDGQEWVGFSNYREFFRDEDSVDFSGWRSLFTSDLYTVGFLLLGAGLIIGLVANSRRNRVGLLEGSVGSIVLLASAVLMFVASVWSIVGERITSGQFLSLPAVLVVLALAGLIGVGVLAVTGKVDSFDSFERTSSSVGSVIAGLFLLSYAVLSVVRGTFFNNIWWVITVTTMSVCLGLAIAALAERAGSSENLAKSFIFMPMAISFVGASIVWRLQYQPRFPATETQTSVLNSAWVELGRLSFSSWPRLLLLAVLAVLIAVLVRSAVSRARVSEPFAPQVVGLAICGFLAFKLLTRSLGGFVEAPDGTYGGPDVVQFLQNAPFNNVFMMIILIWIQTGFAMVIFAAAIKAVPQEFIEAAKVDGATDSQTFFRVIIPQILPTIGVVATTLIVLVTKVFDIVKVSTGGNFGTDVLANDMFDVSFSFFNRGLGSAIAVFILVSVLPVMFLNVRRMQRERVVNR